MKRRGNLLLALAALMLSLGVLYSTATAQERPRTLFDLLFGTQRREAPPAPAAPVRKKAAPTSQAAPVDNPTEAQPVEKLETAKHILVIGDFLASSLGDGLKDAFADSPGVVVDVSTSGSSGLVRDDYYDWIAELPTILDEVKPALLVVEIGSNDRQKMALNGTREEFHSENWTAEYERRVTALASIALKRNIPVLWTGLPAFQSPSFTADVVTINLILRGQVEAAGATFVDIWDGFVDENGKYVATGSDVDGQQARLRGSDGISLTKAGKAKIAFYVEKYARRILGDAALPAAPGQPSEMGLPDISMPQAPQNHLAVRTDPMSMTDPALDGGAALADRTERPAMLVESPRDRLVLHGDPGTPPEGRIDNFKWKND